MKIRIESQIIQVESQIMQVEPSIQSERLRKDLNR